MKSTNIYVGEVERKIRRRPCFFRYKNYIVINFII